VQSCVSRWFSWKTQKLFVRNAIRSCIPFALQASVLYHYRPLRLAVYHYNNRNVINCKKNMLMIYISHFYAMSFMTLNQTAHNKKIGPDWRMCPVETSQNTMRGYSVDSFVCSELRSYVCFHNRAVSKVHCNVVSLAETWCKFWGDGVGALAPNIFLPPPPLSQCEIWEGRRRTHCLLELNVGSVLSCRLLTLYILGLPYILPFNAWFVLIFGWIRLNIEINHINIEPQLQIEAKSIIQFDNQHEFRIEIVHWSINLIDW